MHVILDLIIGVRKLVTLCTLVGVLVSPTALEDQNNPDPKKVFATIEETNSSAQDSKQSPKTNKEYFQEVVQRDVELSRLVEKQKLPEYLSDKLRRLDHVTPSDYIKNQSFGHDDLEESEKPSAKYLRNFHPSFLIRTYLLLQALSDIELRKTIGMELELDTVDRSCEHGGVLHWLSNGTITVEMLPDDSHNPNVYVIGSEFTIGSWGDISDSTYLPKEPEYTLDILTLFHFHAQEVNHSKSAALSSADFWHGGAVFTRVGLHKFNVDYAFYYKKDDKSVMVNVDLGVYTY